MKTILKETLLPFLVPTILIIATLSAMGQNQHVSYESISINPEPAKRFIHLMSYLEQKSPNGFRAIENGKKITQKELDNNLQDKNLSNKIDSLISLPVYDILAKISVAWVDKKKYKGRESYRKAFSYLPYQCIDMRAGMSEQWANFWKNDFDNSIEPLLNYISNNQNRLIKNVVNRSLELVPQNVDKQLNVDIILCFDGNRGSFQWDDKVIMDLLGFRNLDSVAFANVLCHELHHRYYEKWMAKNVSFKGGNASERIMKRVQSAIIMEGIAQQFNFNNKNAQSKELYNNRQLIEELTSKWIASTRELKKQKRPAKYYRNEYRNEYDYAMMLLKKYCPNITDTETFGNRPTIVYYLGYHLYNSIYIKGGSVKLKYAIENPKELLAIYNSIYSSDLLIPRIPDDIVAIWSNNFKN